MQLFHASIKDYSPGQKIVATSQTSFYPLAINAINGAKPPSLPARDICLCATDDLSFAYLFAIKQNWPRNEIRIYKVNMDKFHKAPMAIVHAVQRRIEKSEDISALLSEYWSPTHKWNYSECIGPQMEIVSKVSAPNIDEIIMNITYQVDSDKARDWT